MTLLLTQTVVIYNTVANGETYVTILVVLKILFPPKGCVAIMASVLSSDIFLSLREKQRHVLKCEGNRTSTNCGRTTNFCRVPGKRNVKSHILPALLTSRKRREVTMWRCNSWVQLICVVTLLGHVTLTAATTGE